MREAELDPAECLRQLGQSGEGPHDMARAALMLAALDHAGDALAPLSNEHLTEIAEPHDARRGCRARRGRRTFARRR